MIALIYSSFCTVFAEDIAVQLSVYIDGQFLQMPEQALTIHMTDYVNLRRPL